MIKSRVRAKMQKGEPVFCFVHHFPNPSLAEFIGQFGPDCLWICTEHVATDKSLLEGIIRSCRLTGMDALVRVVRGNYDDLIQPLELGAKGLIIPRVRTAAEVAQIVYDTKFYPIGGRGIDGANPDADMGMVPMKDYLSFSNDNTFLIVQAEDAETVEAVEEIAGVKGIDAIFIGPNDLSQSYGIPGELRHPKIVKAIERTVAACNKNGIYCGTPAFDVDHTKQLLDMGVKFIVAASDYGIIRKSLTQILEDYGSLGFKFHPRYLG